MSACDVRSSTRTLDAVELTPGDAAAGVPPSVSTKLLVKLQLGLPWKPVLAWVWKVTHAFEEREPSAAEPRARVVCVDHRESWEISTLAGVAQVFRPGPEAPLTRA